MAKTIVSLCLLALAYFVSAETGCPKRDDIYPCICITIPSTSLHCKNIRSVEDLRLVFRNSEQYSYNEVHIENSVLPFLPLDVFEKVKVNELHLKKVTLNKLFDKPPNAVAELRLLNLQRTVILRGELWKLLEPLTGLRSLYVYFNVIRTLGSDFSKYASKELEDINFYETETKTLEKGVFSNFTKLDRVAVHTAKLVTLTRDIFPVPFNGRALYFTNNKISTISKDLFSQMPNLQTLELAENQIATVPESAFSGTDFSKIESFSLEGNPLKCDCLLQWITRNKPAELKGKCEGPKKLHGRELKDISPGDFNCKKSSLLSK